MTTPHYETSYGHKCGECGAVGQVFTPIQWGTREPVLVTYRFLCARCFEEATGRDPIPPLTPRVDKLDDGG